jgi:hypothetical protein
MLEEIGRRSAPSQVDRVYALDEENPFAPSKRPIAQETDRFSLSLSKFRDDPAARSAAVSEIYQAAVSHGGWAAGGAITLLETDLCAPDGDDQKSVQDGMREELLEIWVRFLRSLGRPGYPEALCVRDTVVWWGLWPEDRPAD